MVLMRSYSRVFHDVQVEQSSMQSDICRQKLFGTSAIARRVIALVLCFNYRKQFEYNSTGAVSIACTQHRLQRDRRVISAFPIGPLSMLVARSKMVGHPPAPLKQAFGCTITGIRIAKLEKVYHNEEPR